MRHYVIKMNKHKENYYGNFYYESKLYKFVSYHGLQHITAERNGKLYIIEKAKMKNPKIKGNS
jgi:hypothetical protein